MALHFVGVLCLEQIMSRELYEDIWSVEKKKLNLEFSFLLTAITFTYLYLNFGHVGYWYEHLIL